MLDDAARRDLNRDLARLADGDRSAIEPLFALLSPVVVAYCRRLVGDVDAEDAAQLALEKIFRRIADYEPNRSSALTWVLTIATWECRTIRTRRRRQGEAPIDGALEMKSDMPSPEESLAERQLYDAALAVMGTLTARDREVLREAYEDGARGARDASTRKRKERALARLRDAWRRLYGW